MRILIPCLALIGCGPLEATAPRPAPVEVGSSVACPEEVADLWDEVLEDAGASRPVLRSPVPWSDLGEVSPLRSVRFPGFRDAHRHPLGLPCLTRQHSADLDNAVDSPQPVSQMIGFAMQRLGVPMEAEAEPVPMQFEGLQGLPRRLQRALGPVLAALVEANEIHSELKDGAPARLGVLVNRAWCDIDRGQAVWGNPKVRSWVTGEQGPRRLYEPARILAAAVEDADLRRFEGLGGVAGAYQTAAGWVVITDHTALAPSPPGPVALHLDLGGDDQVEGVAGGTDEDLPIAVHIDVAGNDTYGYVPGEDEPLVEGIPEADAAGRAAGDLPASLSTVGRQGSGRFGIGLLFDLDGDDTYRSLRLSQGTGILGVGVLYDAAGNDVYLSEGRSQAYGEGGIGLLLDRAGNDTYHIAYMGQAAAGPLGVAIAYDAEGDDRWWALPGKPDGIQLRSFNSADGPRQESAVQGHGSGVRPYSLCANESGLPGGLGILRDRSGDDTYTAASFAQGTGYFEGQGHLHDGDGADTYDAEWHAQGAAVHFGIGVFVDDGPQPDDFNQQLVPTRYQLGSGRDLSVGIAVLGDGDSTVAMGGMSGGSSAAQSVGVLIDLGGDDSRTMSESTVLGFGNHDLHGMQESRPTLPSVGLFLDAGGNDTYWSADDDPRAVVDGGRFGHTNADDPLEYGGGVDTE